MQTNIYSELPIQLPVLSDGWSEYVHGFQNLDLTFITLSLEAASKLESGTREQSGSAKWKLERAKRITASQFGQVFKRKAAVTEKFLKELFERKTLETPAMKYGLTYQIRAANHILTLEIIQNFTRVDWWLTQHSVGSELPQMVGTLR